MKSKQLYIYRSVVFDGRINAKVAGVPAGTLCQIKLFKDGNLLASADGLTAVFFNIDVGNYQATATLTTENGEQLTLTSIEIAIASPTSNDENKIIHTEKVKKGGYTRYRNVSQYYLQIRLKDEASMVTLKQESEDRLPLLHQINGDLVYNKVPDNYLLGEILPNTYTIYPYGQFDDLVRVADELETLDYVIYCCVVPDTTEMSPPDVLALKVQAPQTDQKDAVTDTPDYQPRQIYLQAPDDEIKGMNVLSTWQNGETGNAATVRHLDFGVYRNHEDLVGNITVVNSRPETEDCNHGTASTGCIVGIENGFGVTGIAHDCDFYFYETGDLELIISQVMPGDIVSLNIAFGIAPNLSVPAINDWAWWERISALTNMGIVVILAAGNGTPEGGIDLSIEAGNINQYGDSRSTLIGSCNAANGLITFSSNYNHQTSLINSWGNRVTTTGIGTLQDEPGHDRDYTADFNGTSSATPLSAGALALIQSYAISKFGIYLKSWEMRQLISETGYSEGAEQGIGHRPDVGAAISMLDQYFNAQ